MEFGELKPLVGTLLLPPASPLLLAGLGLLLAAGPRPGPRARRRQRLGLALAALALALLWLLSCHAVALRLGAWLLPLPPAVAPAQLQAQLQAHGAQAVVVLGGGVLPLAPEYGRAQPAPPTLARLRYGLHLARASGLPVAFSGGVGWAAAGTGTASEAEVAAQVARDDFRHPLAWAEGRSRDTAENAARLRELLQPAGVRRIVLVSDAWHLPRAALEFERAGFAVLPAPTGTPVAHERALLQWLPSAHGLSLSRQTLREWLALRAARAR